MASPSTSTPVYSLKKSHFRLTVCLVDWWLVKAENGVQGRRIGVAGLTDRGIQGMRVFTSAPILKRYDAFNLETADGICVILDGLINKARTLENGFPSAVFIYFNFGFPPYWKDCDERFIGKEPLSKDLPGDILVEQLYLQPESTEDAQPHVDSREEDFRSQGNAEANGMHKSNQTKSLAVALPQGCSVSGLQNESCSGGTSVEDHTAPELTVIFPENEVVSLSDSHCNRGTPGGGGTLSIRHSYNKRTRVRADDLTKMRDKRTKTNSDWDMSSSKKIIIHNKESVMTRSMTKCEMNDLRSAGIAEFGKIGLNCVPSINSGEVGVELVVHRESESRYNCNSEISGLHRNTKKLEFSLSDSASPKQGFDHIPETCSQNKGIGGVETRSKAQKNRNKATELPCTHATPTKSHHDPAAVDNQSKSISGVESRSKMHKDRNKATEVPCTPATPTKSHHDKAAVDNQSKAIRGVGTRSKTHKGRNKATESPCTPATPTNSCHDPAAVDNQSKGIGGVETSSQTHKDRNKATGSPCTPAASTKSHHDAAVDNQRETVINGKSSLSKKAKALDLMTRHKSAPVSKRTPKREKDKALNASPQSGSFCRSRSGRLLMPTLEFWRNQRAIYDADRTITGIEGMDS